MSAAASVFRVAVDDTSARTSNSSNTFSCASTFSYGSSGLLKLPRPRIHKVRRKQKSSYRDGESVNEYHGSKEYAEVSGGIKLNDVKRTASGSFNDQLVSNESVTDSNAKTGKICDGGDAGMSNKDSLFSTRLPNGSFVFGSSTSFSAAGSLDNENDFSSLLSKGCTNVDMESIPTFSFGEVKGGSTTKRNFRGRTRNRLRRELNHNGTGLNQSVRNGDAHAFDAKGEVNDSFLRSPNGKNFVGVSSGDCRNNSEVRSHSEQHAFPSNASNAYFFSSGCKQELEIGSESRGATHNGIFIFGGAKDEYRRPSGNCFSVDKETERFVYISNGSACHSQSSGSEIGSKVQTSYFGSTSEEVSLLNATKELKALKIDDSIIHANKTESFPHKCSIDNGEVFVFRSDKKIPSCKKINHVNEMNEKTPLNEVSFEVPPVTEDGNWKKAACEGGTLNSSDVPENGKLNLPFNLSFVVGDKTLDGANVSESPAKVMKKINKLRKRRGKLLGQNCVPSKACAEHGDDSVFRGSPMDISPYQDAVTDTTPKFDTSATRGGAFDPNRRHQYKKYKLKRADKQCPLQDPSQVCDQWRIRGNLSYNAGKLSEAEEHYSMGINAVSCDSIRGCVMKPLLLCYSNRAATRMSLKRMMEAIEDCEKASELEPTFLKATLRAGNCYLVLGDVESAVQCYTKCLGSETDVHLDRRLIIEAADGLQKAKKVAESSDQAAKLLNEGTKNSALNAVICIEKALSTSCFSECLLEMKGEALCILWRFDEMIRLCEQTLHVAKLNVKVDDRLGDHGGKCTRADLWRWNLQIKAYYHLGRFDMALDLIKKLESMPIKPLKLKNVTQRSSVEIASVIQELLRLKSSGNESFKSGRYNEAIEYYTAAVSKSYESRRFMAICLCNRAAAYQSLNQFADAILDCSLAIALDEKYHKALSRRAMLHEMIRDYEQSASDLQILISLLQTESDSSDKRELISTARSRLSFVEKMAKNETPLDFHRILGVKASDSEAEIKKAYRKAALKHHPDKARQGLAWNDEGEDWNGVWERIQSEAERLFKMIGEAYSVLSDTYQRCDETETMNSNKESSASTSSYNNHGRGRSRNSERKRYYYDHSSTSTRW